MQTNKNTSEGPPDSIPNNLEPSEPNPQPRPPSLSKQYQAGISSKRSRKQSKEFLEDASEDEEIEFLDMDSIRNIPNEKGNNGKDSEVITINIDDEEEEDDDDVQPSKQQIVETEDEDEQKRTALLKYTTRVDEEYVTCNTCEKKLKWKRKGASSNLWRHKCLRKWRLNTPEEKNIQKTLIGSNVYGLPLDMKKQEKIMRALRLFIVTHEQPFKLLEDPSFRKFCWELNDRWRLPAPKTLKTSLFRDLTALETYLKKVLLPNLDSYCVTFDAYTSVTDDHYLAIILVWFDSDLGKLNSKLLKLVDLSDVVHVTGDALAAKLKTVMQSFGTPEPRPCFGISQMWPIYYALQSLMSSRKTQYFHFVRE